MASPSSRNSLHRMFDVYFQLPGYRNPTWQIHLHTGPHPVGRRTGFAARRRGEGATSGKKKQTEPVMDDIGSDNSDNSVTAAKIPAKKATKATKKKQPTTSAQNDAPDEETPGRSSPIKMPTRETAAPLQKPPVTEFIAQALQKLKPIYEPRTRTVGFTFRGIATTTDVGNNPRTLKEDYDAWEEEKNAIAAEAMTYYQKARVIAIEQTAPLDVLRDPYSSAKESGYGTTSTGNKVSTSVDPNQPYTRAKEKARVSLASNPVLLGQVYKEIDQFNDRPQTGSFAPNGFVRSAKASLEKAKAALGTGAAWEHHMPARATLLAIKFCDPNERIEGYPEEVVDDLEATAATGDAETGDDTSSPGGTGEMEDGGTSHENQDFLTGIQDERLLYRNDANEFLIAISGMDT
ncbi:hypothetical protein AB5N19_07696 [Seiridium cardinale]|uniref:Uncharacterized protein n=1 Tax=Seiridium cardinale TaxID=138064 RepID=A0ABR2X7J3_9PEZI